MNNKKVFISLLLMLNISYGISQDLFSLENLINLTLEENYQIRLASNRLRIAENNNTLGQAGFLPSAFLFSEQQWGIDNSESTYVFGDSITAADANSSVFSAMAEVNWVIFDGFKMFANKDRLGYLYQLGEVETKYYIDQSISDLAKAYYRLITELKLRDSYTASQEISKYRRNLEKQKLDVGSGNALLYNQAVVDFNTDSSILVNQDMLIDNLELDINRIINRKAGSDIYPFTYDIPIAEMDSKENLLDRAKKANSELNSAMLEELLAETSVRIEKGDRYPEVTLFGNYTYSSQNSESGFIRERRSSELAYGINIRLNLYSGGVESNEIKNVMIEKENSTINLMEIERNLETNILKILNRYYSYLQQYKLMEISITAAEKSLEIARKQLEFGTINGYDFRQTQLSLLNVKRMYTELHFSLKSQEIDILRLTGTLTEKIMQ